ncbi:MAG: hypothetical protein LBI10_12585 [Deltaproteobacteria bacterium]|jgi:hypothetical protein|nr:hypothetical protein [Deltaproteobacteria bacterium]
MFTEKLKRQIPPKFTNRLGMVLVFVIVVTLLIGLMGAIIIVLTRSEVSISSHYRRSLDAFNTTDSAVNLGALFGRVVLRPILGNPQDLLVTSGGPKPKSPITMEINHKRFNLETLVDEERPYEFGQRYNESANHSYLGPVKPHLTFKINGQIVATASVSLDTSVSNVGYSLGGGDRYDPIDGGSLPVDLVLTVTGTTVRPSGQSDINAPRSIITIFTRELM